MGSTIIPAFRYKDAYAAMDWLCNVLGAERHAVYESDGTVNHAELRLGDGMVMLGSYKDDEYGKRFKAPGELGEFESSSIYVVVSDADAVYTRVQATGSKITRPIQDTPYGSREFSCQDPEGHTWSVGSYDPWASK